MIQAASCQIFLVSRLRYRSAGSVMIAKMISSIALLSESVEIAKILFMNVMQNRIPKIMLIQSTQ